MGASIPFACLMEALMQSHHHYSISATSCRVVTHSPYETRILIIVISKTWLDRWYRMLIKIGHHDTVIAVRRRDPISLQLQVRSGPGPSINTTPYHLNSAHSITHPPTEFSLP
ncbi:hypothetical protein RIF29_07815 [Crotalaria pallida]|uniref:Uncharacterized protein n=1 Tax=Crotalaria pallida TaxID=3830 RepID=A0AAN9J4H8_CROPI